MSLKYLLLVVGALFVTSGPVHADASLKSSLGLSIDQAKHVQDIQKKFRKPFAAKRQELNKEMRVLRRARIANDSGGIARQEQVTAVLREELRQIRLKENEEIRAVLTAEQRAKFEEVLQQRKEALGSSRDEREF